MLHTRWSPSLRWISLINHCWVANKILSSLSLLTSSHKYLRKTYKITLNYNYFANKSKQIKEKTFYRCCWVKRWRKTDALLWSSAATSVCDTAHIHRQTYDRVAVTFGQLKFKNFDQWKTVGRFKRLRMLVDVKSDAPTWQPFFPLRAPELTWVVHNSTLTTQRQALRWLR